MDTARYLYMDVTGQELPVSQLCEGRKWLVEGPDVRAFSIYRQEGTLTFWQWLRSFRGVQEAAWFASDDLKPFWPVLRGIAADGVRYYWSGARRMLGLSNKGKEKRAAKAAR